MVVKKDYSKLQATAARLIGKFGGPVAVREYYDEIDINKPWRVTGSTYREWEVTACKFDFRPDQVEGYAYQRGDEICYIAAKALGFTLTEKHVLIFGTDEFWGIIDPSRLSPNNTDELLFSCYVRRWPKRLK